MSSNGDVKEPIFADNKFSLKKNMTKNERGEARLNSSAL